MTKQTGGSFEQKTKGYESRGPFFTLNFNSDRNDPVLKQTSKELASFPHRSMQRRSTLGHKNTSVWQSTIVNSHLTPKHSLAAPNTFSVLANMGRSIQVTDEGRSNQEPAFHHNTEFSKNGQAVFKSTFITPFERTFPSSAQNRNSATYFPPQPSIQTQRISFNHQYNQTVTTPRPIVRMVSGSNTCTNFGYRSGANQHLRMQVPHNYNVLQEKNVFFNHSKHTASQQKLVLQRTIPPKQQFTFRNQMQSVNCQSRPQQNNKIASFKAINVIEKSEEGQCCKLSNLTMDTDKGPRSSWESKQKGECPIKQNKIASEITECGQEQRKELSLEDFQIIQKIGKGAYGDVFIAIERRLNFVCVLKRISKKKIREKNLSEQLTREIKIQLCMSHKHVTALYGFFFGDSYIYLVEELLADGTLAQKANKQPLSQATASEYLLQLCLGLRYLHIETVIHRDIKPQNLFLHGGMLKIGDFGCSIFGSKKRDTVLGSFIYLSPEQLLEGCYDCKVDMWSLGVLAYELVFGISPFEQQLMKIAKRQIEPVLKKLTFPQECGVSSEAKDFISKLLQLEPQKRININEAIKHPFFTKNIKQQRLKN